MELRDYMYKNRLTGKKFAERINYDGTYINQIKNKVRKPGKKLAQLIENATNGEVTVKELMKE